jgi:hypothetical protein
MYFASRNHHMKPDIKERIIRDFGPDQAAATALVESFEAEQKLSPRISRCVVDLAKGDLSKLENYIERAKYDWRDVIMWAETVPLEYNHPFKDVSWGARTRAAIPNMRQTVSFWKRRFSRIRITPLLILSILALAGSLIGFIFRQHDDEGWGMMMAIILLFGGLFGLLVYSIIRFLFRLNFFSQVLVELFILGLLLLLLKR